MSDPASYLPGETVDEREERTRKRAAEIFLDTHHHLINPRFYTAEQIATKDTLLLRQRWREHDLKVAISNALYNFTGVGHAEGLQQLIGNDP